MLAVLSTKGDRMNRSEYIGEFYVRNVKKAGSEPVYILNDSDEWHAAVWQDRGGRVRMCAHTADGAAMLCTHERRYDLGTMSCETIIDEFLAACFYATHEPASVVGIGRNLGPWTVNFRQFWF